MVSFLKQQINLDGGFKDLFSNLARTGLPPTRTVVRWRDQISCSSKQTQLISPRISGTYNGGTEPYKAILGVGFPLHKPYIQLI